MVRASYAEIDGGRGVMIFCPGCQCGHGVTINGHRSRNGSTWTFNGDLQRPTITPSILVCAEDPARRCHSFVTDGRISFCGDSAHELKNQTVDIPDFFD